MIKRRAGFRGVAAPRRATTPFRATAITAYLAKGGGPFEHAQQIAGHASPKTTKLYNRTADTVTAKRVGRA